MAVLNVATDGVSGLPYHRRQYLLATDGRSLDKTAAIDELRAFLERHPRLFALTGAGVSTGSGIPEYRDERGEWKRPAPVQYQDFVKREHTRQRYWARSLVGWRWFTRAEPNSCHYTLADWEHSGRIEQLVTQNVDRLHQRAGSQAVIDLHGRLDRITCLDCGTRIERDGFQQQLIDDNPEFAERTADIAPDGDAYLENVDFSRFRVPPCPACGGMLKPDVVFFGETIPKARVDAAVAALHRADALLVIGSSLMVYSGFRFCRIAAENDIPIAAINPGRTRADDLISVKVERRFEDALPYLQDAPTGT
ncbi:NAD-dependent protein deacetylase [Thiosocius teredinicola]|uniref:NAD-dependent protein deacetylase n=1 Tax=Thiosocius teredinicola TaxID=1973002 RepID=UPI000990F835